MNRNTGIEKNKRIYLYALLIGYACLLMFFCTKSSPLYIINDWYDANAYFTMGKGIAIIGNWMDQRVEFVSLLS